jgi:accessory gene regulator protein AgrB
MKILTTKAHGFIDYINGLLMIACPWILSFSNQTMASYILIVSGIVTILHSLATDYECGAICQINMQQHLKIDMITGLILAASPLIIHMEVMAPHIILGLLTIGLAFVTHSVPSYKGYHGLVYKKFEKFPSIKY